LLIAGIEVDDDQDYVGWTLIRGGGGLGVGDDLRVVDRVEVEREVALQRGVWCGNLVSKVISGPVSWDRGGPSGGFRTSRCGGTPRCRGGGELFAEFKGRAVDAVAAASVVARMSAAGGGAASGLERGVQDVWRIGPEVGVKKSLMGGGRSLEVGLEVGLFRCAR